MTSIDKLSEEYRQQEADAAFIRFRNMFWAVLFFAIFTLSILLPAVIGE
ncbi:MAG: hypothetical protein Q8934_22985 [Bacillota bacterium]|nr:hypothetical protein [Bacillota bacterium]